MFAFNLNMIQFQFQLSIETEKENTIFFQKFLFSSEPLDMTLSGLQLVMCGIKNWVAVVQVTKTQPLILKFIWKKKNGTTLLKSNSNSSLQSWFVVVAYNEIWHLRTAYAITHSLLHFLFTGNRSHVVEDCAQFIVLQAKCAARATLSLCVEAYTMDFMVFIECTPCIAYKWACRIWYTDVRGIRLASVDLYVCLSACVLRSSILFGSLYPHLTWVVLSSVY